LSLRTTDMTKRCWDNREFKREPMRPMEMHRNRAWHRGALRRPCARTDCGLPRAPPSLQDRLTNAGRFRLHIAIAKARGPPEAASTHGPESSSVRRDRSRGTQPTEVPRSSRQQPVHFHAPTRSGYTMHSRPARSYDYSGGSSTSPKPSSSRDVTTRTFRVAAMCS